MIVDLENDEYRRDIAVLVCQWLLADTSVNSDDCEQVVNVVVGAYLFPEKSEHILEICLEYEKRMKN